MFEEYTEKAVPNVIRGLQQIFQSPHIETGDYRLLFESWFRETDKLTTGGVRDHRAAVWDEVWMAAQEVLDEG